jgi:hypothetical protein
MRKKFLVGCTLAIVAFSLFFSFWQVISPARAATTATTNPYGDANLVSMFDGKTLTGWVSSDAKGWVVKNGTMHSTGDARGYIYYKQQVGTFRWIFDVHQAADTGLAHEPAILFWGTTNPIRDALSALQFQPPSDYHWDYRPGHNNAGTGFKSIKNLHIPVANWAQCEVIGNETTGTASMACCPLAAGKATCKAVEVVTFTDKTAGRVGPLALQVHNKGIQDEYKSLYIESPVKTDPGKFITV